jgi:hypothetical protein
MFVARCDAQFCPFKLIHQLLSNQKWRSKKALLSKTKIEVGYRHNISNTDKKTLL